MRSVHAVILNYKRPGNVPAIVTSCLECPDVTMVHVLDQAEPGKRVTFPPALSRLTYTIVPNAGAGRRVSYAASLPCDVILAIDDDLFPTTEQLKALLARADEQPSRLHGVWGQEIIPEKTRYRLRAGIKNVDRPVDILNRLYVFTPEQARCAIGLAERVGYSWDEMLGPIDDIFLSFAGVDKPLCHDVGLLRECDSSNDDGIAVWKQPDFHVQRREAVRRILTGSKQSPGLFARILNRAATRLF